MLGRELPCELAGVREAAPFAVHLAQAAQREALGRDQGTGLVLGVEGAEEEETVLQQRTGHADPDVEVLAAGGIDLPGLGLLLPPGALQPGRAKVAVQAAVEHVAAAARDDVDDPSRRLPVLRLEARRLDLRLLDEVGGDPGPQGAVGDRIDADTAEARVRDVHAVNDVLIVEAAGAGDRGVGVAGAAGAAHAGDHVQRGRQAAADRQPPQFIAVEDGAHSCRPRVHHRRRGRHVHQLLAPSQVEGVVELHTLAQANADILLLEWLEAGSLDAHAVQARSQIGDQELPVRVGGDGSRALAGAESHARPGHHRPLGVQDPARDRARRRLLGEGRGKNGQPCDHANRDPSERGNQELFSW